MECQGFLILKIARSGSSWLSTMVRGMPDFSFTEEAISARTGRAFPPRTIERYLQKLLTQQRMPRLSSFDHHQRLLLPKKVLAVGGSVCPLNCRGVDFGAVLSSTRSRLIVFVRSNVVKMAVASFRGAQEAVCSRRRRLGMASNLKPNCELPTTLNVSVDALFSQTILKMRENTLLIATAQTSASSYLTMYYERLQRNKTVELERLKRFLGLEWRGAKEEGLARRDRIIKASYDDLSLLIGASTQRDLADAFNARIKNRQVSDCLESMLYAADARVFNDDLCHPASFSPFVANSSLYALMDRGHLRAASFKHGHKNTK